MIPSEFTRECLNRDYAPLEMGEAFQKFVGEALRQRDPHVHTFPTLGRDGAIDHVNEGHGRIQVYETKETGQPKFFQAAKATIAEVAAKLQRNLTPPEPADRRYTPWYNQECPITEYHLCFNRSFSSCNQRQEVQGIVSDCLHRLAKLPHLPHLANVQVRIVDWSDFQDVLKENPHLVFRWFESELPFGLEPYGNAPKHAAGFHAYLGSDRLPFFSPGEYMRQTGGRDAPPDPEELLRQLLEMDESGLVIVGPGGVGKSRLCEEIAKAAVKKELTVLRVNRPLEAGKLQQKRDFFTAKQARYLLVFDYLEDQRETLSDLLKLLEDWRAAFCDIRFLASCRPSFSRELARFASSVGRVELNSKDMVQRAGYGDWVVQCILERLDDEDRESARAMAGGVPALAVFLVYVKETLGAGGFRSLLAEGEFEGWLVKRLLGGESDDEKERNLAFLATLFPLNNKSYETLYRRFRTLLEPLVSDGWIGESVDSNEPQWRFVHDILADKLLVRHVRYLQTNATFFVADAFDLGEQCGALGSVMGSFERNAGEQAIAELPWADLLRCRLLAPEKTALWGPFLCKLIATRLLPIEEREALLDLPCDLWARAHWDLDFQNALGRLLTEHLHEHPGVETIPNTLWAITEQCLAQESPSLLLIPPGLKLMPEKVWEAAVRVVQDRDLSLQPKNSVMASLLEAGLPFEAIGREVRQWLQNNKESVFAARLLIQCCRCDDRSARRVAREFLPDWLHHHGRAFGANYVLRAALRAPESSTGHTSQPLVDDVYVARWLRVFKKDPRARFVIEPWLKSKGRDALSCQDLTLHARRWMQCFAKEHVACRVLGPWLWQLGKDGLDDVRDLVHPWLAEYHTTIEAQYVLCGWLRAHKEQKDRTEATSIQRYVEGWLALHCETVEASYVLPAWLDSVGRQGYTMAEPFVLRWLARFGADDSGGFSGNDAVGFVLGAALEAGGKRAHDEMRQWLSAWLQRNAMSENAGYIYRGALRAGLRLELEHQASEWFARFGAGARLHNNEKTQKVVEEIRCLLEGVQGQPHPIQRSWDGDFTGLTQE
jgi:hypothetical protein